MKKNSTMRVAALLLALTLMTSCFVGGTFAKYTTAGTGTDTARVAKWGVEVMAFNGMFAESYTTHDTDYVGTYTNSVVSGEKVVAPGTSGKMAEINISGQPEVAVEVTYEVTNIYLANWVDNDGNFYCPLKIKINSTVLCGLDYAKPEDFAKAISDNVAAYKESYEAGTILGNEQEHNMDITWEWAFEADGTYAVNQQTDVKDTFLGSWVLRGEDHKPVITLEVKCTVTQID